MRVWLNHAGRLRRAGREMLLRCGLETVVRSGHVPNSQLAGRRHVWQRSRGPFSGMERAGLEPATPSLQSWCSPN